MINLKTILLFISLFFTVYHTGNEKIPIDIYGDSEIGFFIEPHGLIVGKFGFKYSAICKNRRIIETISYTTPDGKIEIERKKGSLKKYKELWGKINDLNVWGFRSITPVDFPGDDEKILLSLYEQLRLEQSNYEFYFRVKKYENKFRVYDILKLRDKKYLNLLKTLNWFFNNEMIIE